MSRTETSPTLAAPLPDLVAALTLAAPDVRVRASDRLAAAHDASHYVLTPQAVVTPTSVEEVGAVLAATRRLGVPVTFRSGGTSLSGQAGTDAVLVDTRRHFRSIEVLDGGGRVRTGPGATVRAVNTRLQRHGRKLGPDPASEIACTIGGVVANNSSGMCCGTEHNTYRTLDASRLVLPSGTVVDTALPDADERLRLAEPRLYAGLLELRDRVRSNSDSVDRIRALFSIKNTMGYGVNSFLDHDLPVDILEHLVVGSEGTLAFVADATFRTVPLNAHVATGLLVFADLAAATRSLPALVAAGFAAIELMDATSLRVAQRDPEATEDLRVLDVHGHAALLVELQEETPDALADKLAAADDLVGRLPLIAPVGLSTDPSRRAALWHIRKGLFTLVAGSRPPQTTALLEDIAVPVESLLATCSALVDLLARHGYEDSVIFGHAKDGNLHFMITERFDDPRSLARYEAFTEDLVSLVLEHGGTLKAEHGTGRIMAPFVRRQYGDELHDVMRAIKELVDPDGLLNPGVVITDDPTAHVRHLKVTLPVEAEVDRCVECGYCEPVCPSRDLTLTPRERIVLRRELERARAAEDADLVAELNRQFEYDGVQTCAVDGMCQTACPVLINTGDLVRRLRSESQGRLAPAAWNVTANHWDTTTRLGSRALSVADSLPVAAPAAVTTVARSALGHEAVPAYTADLPRGGARRRILVDDIATAVHFSSCTTTLFGPAGHRGGVPTALRELCDLAGVRLATPADLPDLCCGTPWKSKGLTRGFDTMKDKVAASLRRATRGGELPVVCDAASCSEGLELLLESAGEAGIRVIDAVVFVDEFVLEHLPPGSRVPDLTVHPTCSSTRIGANPSLMRVAGAAAVDVTVPDDWGCCAFAGDRGMLHPELTASATAPEAAEVRRTGGTAYASLNRTCEIGMARATGVPYRHVLEVLADVVRASPGRATPAHDQ